MIQIMLYVENPELNAKFWKDNLDFKIVNKINVIGVDSYVIESKEHKGVQFVIHDKNVIKNISKEVNLAYPSILLNVNNIELLHNKLKNNGIKISNLENNMFNFPDNEGNYLAVIQN